MNFTEEKVLLQIKAELFEKSVVSTSVEFLNQNIKTLRSILNKYINAKEAELLIFRDILTENEKVILSFTLEHIAFFETWQKEIFIDEINNTDKNDLFKKYNKKLHLNNSKNKLKGVLLLQLNPPIIDFSESFWEQLAKVIYDFFKKAFITLANELERTKYIQLLQFTNQFHSSMDIQDVLSEMYISLKEVYPSFSYHFLMSHDFINKNNLPIQSLDHNKSDSPEMRAFLKGIYTIDNDPKNKRNYLYFPLKGKQGVYGVLKITTSNSVLLSDQDTQFITTLAQTASNAIENAHLYQQSEQRVVDLKLIAKVAENLNTNNELHQLVDYIVGEMKASFSAEEVGFVLLKNNEMNMMEGSTSYFKTEESKILLKYIYEKIVIQSDSYFKGNIVLPDEEISKHYHSVMAEPLISDGKIIGFAVVLHQQPYFFSFNTFKLFQAITHHSSLAFTNSMLREELEKLVITDYLTKLYTRKYLDDKLRESMEEDDMGAFIIIDIDNFKKINDNYGHDVGDEVLIQIAKIIQKHIDDESIGARWGGEELVVYQRNRTLYQGLEFAYNLVELTRTYTDPRVTISAGVSYWNKSVKDNPLSLFKRADEALYIAKNSGKNQAQVLAVIQ